MHDDLPKYVNVVLFENYCLIIIYDIFPICFLFLFCLKIIFSLCIYFVFIFLFCAYGIEWLYAKKSSFSKRINNAYTNCLWSWVAKVAYLSLLISLGATHRAGPTDFKMQPDVGRSEKLMNLTWVKKWWFLISFFP